MGFRPEIKIPPNPMAALRKVPPPVEKNTFWKDEYVRERSKSPMVGENDRASSPNNGGYGERAQVSLNNNNSNNDVNEHVDGYKKPVTTTQQPELNYSNNSTQPQQYTPTPPTYSPQSYQPLQQQQPQYANNATPPLSASTPPQQQQQQSPRNEFRSVAPPQSPITNVYTRQTDSPRADAGTPTQRATESPFRYGGQQQQQQQPQQRAAPAVSPLAQQPQQQSPKPYAPSPTAIQSTSTNNSPNSQPSAQTVPWRNQRTPTQQQQQQQQQPQSTAIYNNVSPQQQQQQLTQQAPAAYQGPKP
ncbi:PREDICTED: mediator of RNA polymerase II transcription subunit 15-like, partial [Rhagoletis zephyria]|uniref:mediator of RNA polymerase II transcription subunit 15-like n=1 Tax=Rhagoletis zephyria TaxID=28612 RepID=UPI0008113484